MSIAEEQIPVVRPKRRRWIRSWSAFLAVGFFVLTLGGLFGTRYHFEQEAESLFEQALADADRLDPGWRWEELEAKRPEIPEEQNSAVLVRTAADQLPRGLDDRGDFFPHPFRRRSMGSISVTEGSPFGGPYSSRPLSPVVRLSSNMVRELRQEMGRTFRALPIARQVAELPVGRYPTEWTKEHFNTPLPQCDEVRRIADVLRGDALLLAHARDADAALTSCRAILNTGRSLGDEPSQVSQRVRMDLTRTALNVVERVLGQGTVDADSLQRMQKLVEDELGAPKLLVALRGERAGVDRLMQNIHDGDVSDRVLRERRWLRIGRGLIMQHNRATALDHFNQAVEAAKEPYAVQRDVFLKLERSARQHRRSFLTRTAGRLVGSCGRLAYDYHRSQAGLSCAVIGLAAERYRLATGDWPAALADLVPNYLERLPGDPFTSDSLRFRKLDDGVVIYSAGRDINDNREEEFANSTTGGGDIAFRLWDESSRAQEYESRSDTRSSRRRGQG